MRIADRMDAIHDAGARVPAGLAAGEVGRGHPPISSANTRPIRTEALTPISSVVGPLVPAPG